MPNDDIKFETPALLRDYVQMTLNMQYWLLIMAPESYMYLFTWVSVSVFGLLNANNQCEVWAICTTQGMGANS